MNYSTVKLIIKLLKNKIELVFFIPILFILFSCSDKKKDEYNSIPIEESKTVFVSTTEIPDAQFLGDGACNKCHEEQFKKWEGSHHDKAMQEANRETILADFNGEKFTSQGVTSRFYKKGTDFFVNTEGPDGTYNDYKVIYTFGIKPLQQYIVKSPDGHYQCLRTAWDTDKNKWFDLYPDFKVVHSEWLHWSRGGLNWNNMCSDCHSTNVRKKYDQETHSYDTRFSLINVSCEACHGPGKQHVDDVNELGEKYRNSETFEMTITTKPKELVDQCARCHMRREQISEKFNFEGTMLDHYFPQLITERIYYPDGQILDEDYVYGSFVQSKMYKNNVTCSSCHDSHSLQLKFKENKLCSQCHLPEKYNTPDHHFHKNDTDGAKCINCHMTGRFYMGNDFRRDHSFRVPRPDLSLKYDTPNACVQCHKDKDNAWAWENFKEQYGVPDYQHFSELLAPGLLGHLDGMESLLTLVKDTAQPDIARASAVRSMSNYIGPETVSKVLLFLNDSSPMVRATSLDVLSELNTTDYVNYFLPLLKDEKRSVRVKAFFGIGGLGEDQIPESYKEVYKKVKKEFFAYLKINSDFVGGRVKKANYYLKKGDVLKGIEGYESALAIDPINNIARTNLANLYYNNGELDKAEAAFKTIISQEPEYGPTYYSLGLLFAEEEKIQEAIEQLEIASKYMPQNIRVFYNLSLLYDKNNESKKAEKAILQGLKITPENENLLYALAYHYSKNNQIDRAINVALRLIEMYPGNQQYQSFLQNLRAAR